MQYFIINSELNLSPGKACAQVAHVATIITHNIAKKLYSPINSNKYIDPKEAVLLSQWIEWFKNNQKKIILKGKEKDLSKLINQGFYYIKDIGCNECESNSLTCVGLPPMKRSEAQKYIKRLQLY